MSAPFDWAGCSAEQLWRHVAAHLERRGIQVVLVGGSVVSIYSKGAYVSGDLDFVSLGASGVQLRAAMEELDFQREGRHYTHPECSHLFVEFVSGPLGIGDDSKITPAEVFEGELALKILSPTDSVRDRLASYIHFRARECLDQAALVARARNVDWSVIERWCRGEGAAGTEAFAALQRLIEFDPGGSTAAST